MEKKTKKATATKKTTTASKSTATKATTAKKASTTKKAAAAKEVKETKKASTTRAKKETATKKTEVKETKKESSVVAKKAATTTTKKASIKSESSSSTSETKREFNSFQNSDRPFAKYNRGYPNKQGRRKKFCKLCAKGQEHVDYKDVELLYKYLTPNLKIASRKITFACSKHQTRVSNAIKRARIVALIPFVRD